MRYAAPGDAKDEDARGTSEEPPDARSRMMFLGKPKSKLGNGKVGKFAKAKAKTRPKPKGFPKSTAPCEVKVKGKNVAYVGTSADAFVAEANGTDGDEMLWYHAAHVGITPDNSDLMSVDTGLESCSDGTDVTDADMPELVPIPLLRISDPLRWWQRQEVMLRALRIRLEIVLRHERHRLYLMRCID